MTAPRSGAPEGKTLSLNVSLRLVDTGKGAEVDRLVLEKARELVAELAALEGVEDLRGQWAGPAGPAELRPRDPAPEE